MSSTTKVTKLQSGVQINAVISHPPACAQHSDLPTPTPGPSLVPLAATAYHTIGLDFRAWGASSSLDDKGAHPIAALADDTEEVMAALNIKNVVLVGLSMGAKVGQLLAARMSSETSNSGRAVTLRGLVLVSPTPPTPLVLPADIREQQLHAYDSEDSAEFVARNILTSTFQSRNLPSFVVSDMLRGSKWATKAWPTYAMTEDVSGAVTRVAVPVLILAAAEDAVEPLGRVQVEVCSRFPGARLEVLDGCGHLLNDSGLKG
ncbi:alpha/beta-hydrolase [Chaetomidium leptoderma]|uniref:Alpha/beta-hydrolase n=1 Tax=Chaetomidium leptoderma TaxID=669021 RepID=A0AAN6VIF1_9PEZI|nr:alpha/beta-hydrolase [Chaetomidium leptoderma]